MPLKMKQFIQSLTTVIIALMPTFANAEATAYSQHEWPAEQRSAKFNLDDGVGLYGYDPVSYFAGRPTEGRRNITREFRGVTYRFATAANKAAFDADPAKYEPAFGGWCAYAMAENGDTVEVDPESYKIVDGQIFLFYDGFWGDTLKKWNKWSPQQQKRKTAQANANWAQAAK